MGYLHIQNLYKDQTILLFKECFALEKIHGTSAHVSFKKIMSQIGDGFDVEISFFSGGEKHNRFVSLFDEEKLKFAFKDLGTPIDKTVTVYGEAYGGSCQGMSDTYGKELKFAAFDVQVGEVWLSVLDAADVCRKLDLEFVHYTQVSTDIGVLDAARDAQSVQAIRNGVGPNKKMEGVVLRPLKEMTLNNGARIIAKHKRDEFKETSSPRPIVDPAKLQVLADANAVANEWITATRLQHVLDKIPEHGMEKMGEIIYAMKEDVLREGAGEIVPSKDVEKAISSKTVSMYKDYLKSLIK
jgi:hypothetical protein